jgi:hypothetical protein
MAIASEAFTARRTGTAGRTFPDPRN